LKTATKKLYEGMFLVDSALASDDWDVMINTIQNLLARYDADIESIKKWDSRRLAYKINGKIYGMYILAYFRIDGTKISSIERDVQLSENIMRVMILRTDRMSKEDLEKDTPMDKVERREKEIAEKVEKEKAKATEIPGAKAPEEQKVEQPQQEINAQESTFQDSSETGQPQIETGQQDQQEQIEEKSIEKKY
jgi:small subunit ribosomal protein S6